MTSERESLKLTGDIMGTVMGWLTDTAAGGATTFYNNDQMVKFWPTRGAAAFWFGLTSDGHKDHGAIHSGCPVLAGSKWIINKWVFSFNQFDKYPCDVTRRRRIPVWDKYRTW